jgi:hypothetical protein
MLNKITCRLYQIQWEFYTIMPSWNTGLLEVYKYQRISNPRNDVFIILALLFPSGCHRQQRVQCTVSLKYIFSPESVKSLCDMTRTLQRLGKHAVTAITIMNVIFIVQSHGIYCRVVCWKSTSFGGTSHLYFYSWGVSQGRDKNEAGSKQCSLVSWLLTLLKMGATYSSKTAVGLQTE